jgi:hypothetical protein
MLVAVHYYLSLAQMGGCIPDNPTTARQGTARRPNLYNPMYFTLTQTANHWAVRYKLTRITLEKD